MQKPLSRSQLSLTCDRVCPDIVDHTQGMLGVSVAILLALPPHPPTLDPFDVRTWDFYASLTAAIVQSPPSNVRNLQITQAYHEISPLFGALTHSGDANWPTIAVWASNTVGMGIRKKMLPHWMSIVAARWPEWLRKMAEDDVTLIDVVADKLLRVVSDALSGGNSLVFDEIGGSFARFGQYVANISKVGPDPARLNAFLSTLTAEQPLLKEAFTYYYRSMWEAENRTQLLFYANALVGLDEQTRLQPAISGAFLHDYNITILGRNISLHVEALMTIVFETLLMPSEVLWVRKDVPPRPWDGRDWAPGLEELTIPGLLPLYRKYVPTDNERTHTGATDWVKLSDRMRYVWPLFRGRQDDPNNNCPPFSTAQVADIWSGTAPPEEAFCLPYNASACCRSA
jgi:hypothetical protein